MKNFFIFLLTELIEISSDNEEKNGIGIAKFKFI